MEQYTVHLGSDCRFDDYLDAMLIDDHWLDRPWPRGNATAVAVALVEAERETPADCPHRSLLAALHEFLLEHIRLAPTLERASAAFGCSPATFKRHLAQHGTHFQAELDQVRAHVSLRLMREHGYGNEQIARYLGFHDATNFRRSFKRWTGLTPSTLRHRLLQQGGE
jgi:AraC-like DNA-binding protein